MLSEKPSDILHAPVLKELNSPWRNVLQLASRITVRPNSWLLQNDVPGLDFYFIMRGKIFVMHSDPSGRERAIFCLGQDNLFNEAPASAGFDVPNSPFFCREESILYRFPHTLLHDRNFVLSYPELMINLLAGLSIKLLFIHTSLSNFTGIDALGRVSRFFYSLAARHKELAFDPGMTQEALAMLLGMNRATLVRALHELKKCGAVRKFTRHALEIADLELLRKLGGA